MSPDSLEKRWPWWGQARDTLASLIGVAIVAVESYRGTYNPIAMGFAAACIGIATSGTIGRALVQKWEGEKRP
jgi:hypothetical protein